jgi:3-oxoacyl-[acyl-carrier-protein] synthase-3
VRENSEWPPEFSTRPAKHGDDRTLVDVQLTRENDTLRKIVERYLADEARDPFLGSRRRRVADASVSAVQAEAWAAEGALADAGIEASDLDAIFSWALVPDRIMPSNACGVGHLLGAHGAWSATVDTACASPVTQLGLAASLIESGRARTVLMTQSHLATKVCPLMHPATPCVGDGAPAILVQASETPGVRAVQTLTQGEHYDAVLWCRHRDPTQDSPWWQAGGPQMMSSHAPDTARALIKNTVPIAVETVRQLLERSRIQPFEIDALASMQPRSWVPHAIAEGLGLSPDIAPQTYHELAHLGGAGMVANLVEARKRGLLKPGANVVLYAQGAGFTRGAVHVRW